jgi:Arc/MetJ-type ribon-helix-helix transcriptional regulator
MRATSFKFDENTTRLLDELKESSHASSRTEVIRKALYLLDLASKAQKKNERLVIQSADGQEKKEILMY